MKRRRAAPAPRLLRQCLAEVRGEFARSVGWAASRQCAFLALPWLLGRAVDAGVARSSPGAAAGWALAFVAVAAVEYAGMRGWQLWSNLAEARAGTWLRGRLLKAVLAVDTETLRRRTDGSGDLTTRATREVDTVLTWVHGLTTWVVIGLTGLVLVPAIGGLDPLLLLVAALTVPVLMVLNRVFPPVFARRAEELSEAHGRRASAVGELLAALLPLRGVGAEGRMVERHHLRSAEVTRRTRRLASVSSVWEAAAAVVPLLAVAAGLLAGGHAVVDGRITVGALTTFVLWMGTVSLAVTVMIARLGDRGEALVAAGRISAVLALAPAPGAGVALPRAGALRVRGLTVRRTGRAPVGPLDLDAVPGEWIALTGPTGCGKSTLLRALARLVPYEGEAGFGGVPLADAGGDELYDTVGLVPDGPLLLHGTVRENLLLTGDHDDAVLDAAARVAGLDLALAPLSDGWDTQVGERGRALSGGQRHLVALARALLRDGPVLLLDDVTAALDARTEAVVLARLREATVGRIVVLATHSPAVRALADREIVLPHAVPPDSAADVPAPRRESPAPSDQEACHG
ncbi:ABC transporter transmembrane domain-containing protein [Streptomyces uncialis]|uniref:ABC transporter transmembrane domain-containing protein n=1 Tax=Streptomyces uncialis TaxID=1048205 RepID=UPI0037F1C258